MDRMDEAELIAQGFVAGLFTGDGTAATCTRTAEAVEVHLVSANYRVRITTDGQAFVVTAPTVSDDALQISDAGRMAYAIGSALRFGEPIAGDRRPWQRAAKIRREESPGRASD